MTGLLARCWKPWRHLPHWHVGPGYQTSLSWCTGGYSKKDVTLCR